MNNYILDETFHCPDFVVCIWILINGVRPVIKVIQRLYACVRNSVAYLSCALILDSTD